MKIIITFLAILSLTSTYGQNKEEKNKKIIQIRKLYNEINEFKNYKIIKIENSEEFLETSTDNGGSLVGYYNGNKLKKIVEWIGLSNRVIQNEYYFTNGNLFFVFSSESNYKYDENTQSFDYTKLENTFKGRYYYENGQLIETILSDKQRLISRSKDASSFLIISKSYSTLLNKKNR